MKEETEDWKWDLYVEVTEDLIFMAKMFHLARDKKQANEDIRNQLIKLEDFISIREEWARADERGDNITN